MKSIEIRHKGGGIVSAWIDGDDYYIRESLDRGRDIQTICLSRSELQRILALLSAGEGA